MKFYKLESRKHTGEKRKKRIQRFRSKGFLKEGKKERDG